MLRPVSCSRKRCPSRNHESSSVKSATGPGSCAKDEEAQASARCLIVIANALRDGDLYSAVVRATALCRLLESIPQQATRSSTRRSVRSISSGNDSTSDCSSSSATVGAARRCRTQPASRSCGPRFLKLTRRLTKADAFARSSCPTNLNRFSSVPRQALVELIGMGQRQEK